MLFYNVKVAFVLLLFGIGGSGWHSTRQTTDRLSKLRVKFSEYEKLNVAVNLCPVDNDLILSIIKVESNFEVDAYNPRTLDYGLMQVNHYHVEKDNLNVNMLLSSILYNVYIGCNILEWFVSRYGMYEGVVRYNVGTADDAVLRPEGIAYADKVFGYYELLTGRKIEMEVSDVGLE